MIIAVIYVTFAVANQRKESLKTKSGLYGIRTLELCDTERSNRIPYKP